MRLLDKYIVISSVFALFTEDFNFHYIIDLKLFYVFLITNFVLLAINHRITIHKNLLIIIGFLFVHGIINFIIFSNPIWSLIAQIIGISVSSIYYYNFIKIYGKKNVFKTYLDTALVIAILAIPMFFLNINTFIYNRLNGIMSEPAHYAAIMLPAAYVFFRDKKYLKFAIILITIVLSKSTIGYIGLFFMMIMPLLKVKYFLKYSIVALIIICISGFYIHSKWNEPIHENESNVLVRRLKQTEESLNAVYTGKFKKDTNLSSYALLSNLFITKMIFFDKPLGAGLGAYQYEYEKNYNYLSPPEYLITLKESKINKTDANSLFLRMLADLGIFGLLMIIYFYVRSFKVFSKESKVIEQGAFFYLFVKLIREGHYFPPEFYFFLLIFLKEFDEDIAYS